jgi:hypothetical protein
LWEAEHRLLVELNTIPEGRTLLDRIAQRHRVVIHDEDLNTVLKRLILTPPTEGGHHD